MKTDTQLQRLTGPLTNKTEQRNVGVRRTVTGSQVQDYGTCLLRSFEMARMTNRLSQQTLVSPRTYVPLLGTNEEVKGKPGSGSEAVDEHFGRVVQGGERG